jgi:thiamine biosynthesis lipoprotein
VTTHAFAGEQWQVWGCRVDLVVARAGQLGTAVGAVSATLHEVDRACSRFRDDSDLTRVNASAGHWVGIGPVLADVLEVAITAARVSDGLVDPLLGASLTRLGYDRDLGDLDVVGVEVPLEHGPADPGIAQSTYDCWRSIEIERTSDAARVRIPPGRAVDLGAIGKAWAVDAAAARLAAIGVPGILAVGGDVAVAGAGDGEACWRVDVAERPGQPPATTVLLPSGGMATSSTTHRRWRHPGGVAQHIVDPRTGLPADEVWRTATVAAASATAANTASTAAIVRGKRAVDRLCRDGMPARLVAKDGSVVTVAGWPAEVAA